MELLLHFFKFYSEWSGEEVVAIHYPPDKILSPTEAKSLAEHPVSLGYKVRPFREISPLIIQDPFEFDHNVCKSLSKANFTSFIRHLRIAAELLSSKNSILPLFDREEYQNAEVMLLTKPRRLTFNQGDLKELLWQSQTFSALAECVDKLDLKVATIHEALSKIALKAIVKYLEEKLDFNCSPSTNQPTQQPANADIQPTNDSATDPTKQPTSADVHSTDDSATEPTKQPTSAETGESSSFSSMLTPKTCVQEPTPLTVNSINSGDPCTRKRAHPSDVIDEQTDEAKRTKNEIQSVTTLDTLRRFQSECESESYNCTAMTNTWTRRRKKLRQQQQQQQQNRDVQMDTTDLTDSLPLVLPVLCVKLSIDYSELPTCTIVINQLPPLNINEFKNWYAIINKELRKNHS